MRLVGDGFFPEQYLSILHADGTETRLNDEPIGSRTRRSRPAGRASCSPGCTTCRVCTSSTPRAVNRFSSRSPKLGEDASTPRFSPDGSRITYLAGNRDAEVWVANADGTDAHEILTDEPTAFRDVTGLDWSPEGDRPGDRGGYPPEERRLHLHLRPRRLGLHGSDRRRELTVLVARRIPDRVHDPVRRRPDLNVVQFDPQAGSRPAGLAIADADGSNVRAFGFAASGPWLPPP